MNAQDIIEALTERQANARTQYARGVYEYAKELIADVGGLLTYDGRTFDDIKSYTEFKRSRAGFVFDHELFA